MVIFKEWIACICTVVEILRRTSVFHQLVYILITWHVCWRDISIDVAVITYSLIIILGMA